MEGTVFVEDILARAGKLAQASRRWWRARLLPAAWLSRRARRADRQPIRRPP